MKRKLAVFLIAFIMCVGGVITTKTEAQAEGMGTDIDFSYLVTKDALMGTLQSATKGVYLLDGSSIINRMGIATVGAGGSTTAAKKCRVSILVIVEQQAGSGWDYWTSWTVTEENSYSASASRAIPVATGHAYRVRCTHSAGTDAGSSWTGALQM